MREKWVGNRKDGSISSSAEYATQGSREPEALAVWIRGHESPVNLLKELRPGYDRGGKVFYTDWGIFPCWRVRVTIPGLEYSQSRHDIYGAASS
jgi:hypothetical protein